MKRYLARAKKQELSPKPKLSIASEVGLIAITKNLAGIPEHKFRKELLKTLARILIIQQIPKNEAKSLWQNPTDVAGLTGTINNRSPLVRKTLREAHYSGRILYPKEEVPCVPRITPTDLNGFLAQHKLPPLETSRKISYPVWALMQDLDGTYTHAQVYDSRYSALR